ncbi:MAG: hypothetical protein AAFP97_02405 [Pseudomonadota bacterium]
MVFIFKDIAINILPGFKFSTSAAKREIKFSDADKKSAWQIYVELATRISTQALHEDEGTEEAALSSLHTLFQDLRKIIRENGPEAVESARIGVFVLNIVLRPFMARWHKIVSARTLTDVERKVFREELKEIQRSLKSYATELLKLLEIGDDKTLLGEF